MLVEAFPQIFSKPGIESFVFFALNHIYIKNIARSSYTHRVFKNAMIFEISSHDFNIPSS